MKQGFVYLVGAGCGSADLITLRGMEALGRCTALVYDDLIDPALLDAAPEGALRRYMGKRSGAHSAAQEEINAALISLAQAGHTVVRLKGGDPYVFGRGGEEALALKAAGIPFEVVPGISSPIAIPALAGIPVTHRGVSQGLHIVTGHTAAQGLPDFAALAQLSGTLVFLMGLGHLEEIAQGLMGAGLPSDTPAAVLSGGNAPCPATVRGTLSTISQAAKAVQPPAVILVGQTAALDLSPPSRPLEGVRIGVTGSDAMAQKLLPPLRALGASACHVQRHRRKNLPETLERWTPTPGEYLVFTSGNGVDVFFHLLRQRDFDLRGLALCRFAVIGAATREQLRRHGYHADLQPPTPTTAALAQSLSRLPQGTPVTLLRSAKASPLPGLPEANDLRIYDMIPQPPRDIPLDYLLFSSAGGVKAWWDACGQPPEGTTCLAIGPVTAQALKERTARPILLARDISAQGILDAILSHSGCDFFS